MCCGKTNGKVMDWCKSRFPVEREIQRHFRNYHKLPTDPKLVANANSEQDSFGFNIQMNAWWRLVFSHTSYCFQQERISSDDKQQKGFQFHQTEKIYFQSKNLKTILQITGTVKHLGDWWNDYFEDLDLITIVSFNESDFCWNGGSNFENSNFNQDYEMW